LALALPSTLLRAKISARIQTLLPAEALRGPALMADPDRLLLIMVSGGDADRLIRRMVERGLQATKISSTGGFLRRGNATLLSGVPDARVDEVLELVREECRARVELAPLQALPFLGDGIGVAEPIEVRTGGATVFVLDVLRFERA